MNSDLSLPSPEALIAEIEAMRARLVHLSDNLNAGEQVHGALARAASWLGDVTNPFTPEELAAYEEHAETIEEGLHECGASMTEQLTMDDLRAHLDYLRDNA